MNHLNLADPETGLVRWSLVILEPDELYAISCGVPAIIDVDPDDADMPMLTLACEEDSDRLQEILSTGDPDFIMQHLRHEQPAFGDTIESRTRQDYERAVKEHPPHKQMRRATVIPGKSINVAPGAPIEDDSPDRICLSIAVKGSGAEVCYELTKMADADKLIALLISARNRLWPHGRICV